MTRPQLIIIAAFATLAAGAFSLGCVRIGIRYGFLPCNHECYWCGKPLEVK